MASPSPAPSRFKVPRTASELRAGSSIVGNVFGSTALGASNTLVLGGTVNDVFAVSALGSQYLNFDRFSKTGAGTWALTGTTAAVTPWTISGGTLSIANDASLGAVAGALTLNGGTLQTTADVSTSRAMALGAAGGRLSPVSGTTLTVDSVVSGDGGIAMAGAGMLVLNNANTYTGGTSVAQGELIAAVTGALGSGPVNVATSATLGFRGTADARDIALGLNGGFVQFRDDSSAGLAQISAATGASTEFRDRASAGLASIDNAGGVTFYETSSAAGARIVNRSGGETTFFDNSSAGKATITNASGGLLDLFDASTAAEATVINNAGGRVRVSGTTTGTNIGSLSGDGNVILGARALTTGGLNTGTTIGGTISGVGGSLVKEGTGTLTLTGSNTYTGGTALKQRRIDVGSNAALGSGELAMDDGTALGFAADGLTLANAIRLTGSNDPVIDTGSFSETLAGAISGGGFLTKQGSGTLTLSGANSYTGATNVAQGTLRAGAVNAFSPASSVTVSAGATLHTAGFSQTVAGLTNAGTVSLLGNPAGSTLTVNGNYVGNNGLLQLGTSLGGNASATDRLVISGSASGSTTVQVTNLAGLGGQTTGDGISIVSAAGGIASNAFSLAAPVSAGAYDYRLNVAGTAAYLSSTIPVTPVDPTQPINPAAPAGPSIPMYRAEVPLYAALPEQLRQANLAMLGSMHQRTGDDGVSGSNTATAGQGNRQAWGRIISIDRDISQSGTVSPTSKGRLNGFQAGTDLWATPDWKTGIYVGHLDGDMSVRGFARGIANYAVGSNDLRSQYLGAYATWKSASGLYVDGVLQAGRHRTTANPAIALESSGKGNSLLASIEAGQSFQIAPNWTVEPQLQLVKQRIALDDSAITGALVQQDANGGWMARAGVRVKGHIETAGGMLQPYARLNVYKRSSGTDTTRFVGPAAFTDITTRTGGTSSELAAGATWQLSQSTSLYGEVGKLWASGGSARTRSGIDGSAGVKVQW